MAFDVKFATICGVEKECWKGGALRQSPTRGPPAFVATRADLSQMGAIEDQLPASGRRSVAGEVIGGSPSERAPRGDECRGDLRLQQ